MLEGERLLKFGHQGVKKQLYIFPLFIYLLTCFNFYSPEVSQQEMPAGRASVAFISLPTAGTWRRASENQGTMLF